MVRSVGMGIVMFIGGLIGVIDSYSLFRNPQRLQYNSIRYRAIRNRMRRWPRKSKEYELSLDEVRSYAKVTIVFGSIVAIGGALVIILSPLVCR